MSIRRVIAIYSVLVYSVSITIAAGILNLHIVRWNGTVVAILTLSALLVEFIHSINDSHPDQYRPGLRLDPDVIDRSFCATVIGFEPLTTCALSLTVDKYGKRIQLKVGHKPGRAPEVLRGEPVMVYPAPTEGWWEVEAISRPTR